MIIAGVDWVASRVLKVFHAGKLVPESQAFSPPVPPDPRSRLGVCAATPRPWDASHRARGAPAAWAECFRLTRVLLGHGQICSSLGSDEHRDSSGRICQAYPSSEADSRVSTVGRGGRPARLRLTTCDASSHRWTALARAEHRVKSTLGVTSGSSCLLPAESWTTLAGWTPRAENWRGPEARSRSAETCHVAE